jgi:uncharacterized protein (DUF58 family)
MQKLSEIKDFDNIEFLAKQVVEGFIIGLHKSPFHGFSVEFAEHRLYNPGESTKNIDWKVFARTDKMFVKRYEEETNLRCQIVIDASSSMYFPKDEKGYGNKMKFSVLSAAAIINLLKRQRDAAGLSIFSNHLMVNMPAKSSSKHLDALFSNLENLVKNPFINESTDIAKCLHQIAETTHRRSLIILFSDMFDHMATAEREELYAALQHLRFNKHEVILFHVKDKTLEEDFAFENRPYVFVDMENGEEVKLQAAEVREHYTTQIQSFKKELKMRCGQFQIDLVEADIEAGFREVLLPFLTKRKKLF